MWRDTSFTNFLARLGGLAREAVAGANLALAMLPKAMAYAAVAGVPPAYGLYASCAAPALAVAFGKKRSSYFIRKVYQTDLRVWPNVRANRV